jgi:receptor protein-tyrosine kinase
MTGAPKPRSHLVERAAARLGPAGGVPPLPPVPDNAPAAPRPRAPIEAERLIRAGLIDRSRARSRLVEEIAIVQHQALRNVDEVPAALGRNARLILVTSAMPGEGKTFSALNVAAGIAASGGRSAVLVDLDGKCGSLTEMLGCEGEPGLRNLVAGASPPSVPPLRTEQARLSFLPYGANPPGARPVPSGAAIAAAVLRLAAALPDRILLLDAPPCLATSEASVLAPVVGQVMLVVQAERVQREQVEAALDMVAACPSVHLLLNQMHQRSQDTFGAVDYEGVYAPASESRA